MMKALICTLSEIKGVFITNPALVKGWVRDQTSNRILAGYKESEQMSYGAFRPKPSHIISMSRLHITCY